MAEVIEERRGRVMVLTMPDPATRNARGLEIFLKAADACHRAAHEPPARHAAAPGLGCSERASRRAAEDGHRPSWCGSS